MTKILTIKLIFIVFTITSFAQWTQIPLSPSYIIQDIVESNGVLYLAHYGNGIYRSTDGAVSWQQINNGLNSAESKRVYEVLLYNGSLYAATEGGIYKSTNDGTEWIKKSNGITIGPGASAEFCESIFDYKSNLFTGAWNGIYRSSNNAENWELTNVSGQGILAKNFTGHNGILFAAREVGNQPSGYKSTDNGITWAALTSITLPSITFLSEPPYLWAGTIDGVWLSTDNGLNWKQRNNGLSADPYSSCILRVNGILTTTLKFGGSGVYISTNEGILWENFGDGLPFLNSIEKLLVYNNIIIAATSDGLWQRDVSQVPVELISFSASVSGSNINLSWSTSTETNNHGFEILRFEQNDNVWKSIGFVTGFGTTTEPKSYSFTDFDVETGKYFYRLKQIDFDGSFEYSDIVEAEILSADKFVLNQNYPNPFNPSTKINFVIPQESFVSIKVFDVIGNEITTLVNEVKKSGSYEVEFVADKLPSGVYVYQLRANNFIKTKKMMLLR